MKILLIFTTIGLVLFPTSLDAQEPPPEIRWDLPNARAEEVIQRLNDPELDLRDGETVIEADSVIAGDLAVLDGRLTLRGTIAGDLLVVNGDAILEAGAVVTGDVLVIGGEIQYAPDVVRGEIITYAARLPYERLGGRIRLVRAPRIAGPSFSRDGSSDFLITTGKSYNRVEGMPISFGPRLQTEGSNPFRLQALGVYRSESGFRLRPEEMGYFVRVEQFIGGHREYRVGATLHSLIDPIEEWQLSDLESGLATFLFHKDYRDHYEREGWSLFSTWEPHGVPYRLHLETRWETHGSRPSGSPWSVFRDSEAWRPQPVVAEGRFGSLLLLADYDSRGSMWNPSSGWFARGQIERSLRVDIARPVLVELPGEASLQQEAVEPLTLPAQQYEQFLAALVDIRSYNRIDADSRLNLRVVAGGSLTGDPLPPQRQHALGGEGSLPGYGLFSSDCGARSIQVAIDGSDDGSIFHPDYGCDAFALVQAEVRGKLAFRFRWDVGPWREGRDPSDRVWDFGWDMSPDWALFVDAGRGWAYDDRPNDDVRVNVGAGILLERIGVYVALPVTGGSGANLFVRLGPRF